MSPATPRHPHIETDNTLWYCPECGWPLAKAVGQGFFYYYADGSEPQRHDGKWIDCGKPFHPHDARNPLAIPSAPKAAVIQLEIPMNYRVISLGTHPLQLLNHIRAAGCIIRLEPCAVRGPVAFVGDGRVWAVGTLRDVKPATKHKDAPQGYLWCFSELQDVEGIECGNYGLEAMFMNGEELEPQLLQASAQAALNELFGAIEEEVALGVIEAEKAPELAAFAMPPDYQIEAPMVGELGKAGQLGMVF